jgi:hypothetical protein
MLIDNGLYSDNYALRVDSSDQRQRLGEPVGYNTGAFQ